MNRQINRDQFQQHIERLLSWIRLAMETVASGTSFFVDRGKSLNGRSVWSDADLRRLRRDGQLIVQPRWSQVSEALAGAAVKPSSSRISPNTRNRH